MNFKKGQPKKTQNTENQRKEKQLSPEIHNVNSKFEWNND